MTQEAAYKQIQDAKTMVEDDLTHKLEEFEEERERLIKLANTASNLEMELEQVVIPRISLCKHSFFFLKIILPYLQYVRSSCIPISCSSKMESMKWGFSSISFCFPPWVFGKIMFAICSEWPSMLCLP